jgi:hypothetical protein
MPSPSRNKSTCERCGQGHHALPAPKRTMAPRPRSNENNRRTPASTGTGPGRHDREQRAKIDDERAQKTLRKQGKTDRAQRLGRGGCKFKSYHSDQHLTEIPTSTGTACGTVSL